MRTSQKAQPMRYLQYKYMLTLSDNQGNKFPLTWMSIKIIIFILFEFDFGLLI